MKRRLVESMLSLISMSAISRPLSDFNYYSNSLKVMLNLLLLIIKLLYKTDKKG